MNILALNNVVRLSPSRSSTARHHITVLAIFRNEAHVLREWIEHYLVFGVDHFYLIDNNSDDDYRTVLAPYVERGLVDLFFTARDGYQIGAYTELLPILKAQAEWVGVFDLDEFIYPPYDRGFADVLGEFAQHEVVLAPWLSFGSSGFVTQPGSVTESFTRRGPAQVSRAFLKAFSRPRSVQVLSQHNPQIGSGTRVLANGARFGTDTFIALDESRVGDFRLLNNHYRLQSLDYFTKVKTARPEVNEAVAANRKAVAFFLENDPGWNQIVDRGILDARGRCRRAPP